MKVPSRIRLTFYFLAFAGAALFVGLLIREGAPQVGKAIASAGWAILAVIAYHLCVPVFLDALAWWVLFPKIDRPPLPRIFGCVGSANRSVLWCRPPQLVATLSAPGSLLFMERQCQSPRGR